MTLGACPMVTMGRPQKSLKVTMGGRRPDAYNEGAKVPNFVAFDMEARVAGLFRNGELADVERL